MTPKTAIVDWFSRYVLSWELSITLEADFCVTALERMLLTGKPEIFNTDLHQSLGYRTSADVYRSVMRLAEKNHPHYSQL